MMKTYEKPALEIIVLRADENIAAFNYKNGDVPVTLFNIQSNSWNGTPHS